MLHFGSVYMHRKTMWVKQPPHPTPSTCFGHVMNAASVIPSVIIVKEKLDGVLYQLAADSSGQTKCLFVPHSKPLCKVLDSSSIHIKPTGNINKTIPARQRFLLCFRKVLKKRLSLRIKIMIHRDCFFFDENKVS